MPYHKFVQVGRVVMVAKGPNEGKLAVIVNVIDQNRVLIDGPESGVPRVVANFKDLQLTKFVVKCGPGARTGSVSKAWKKADMSTKWGETAWAKKMERQKLRDNMTDYDRFKLMKARQLRRKLTSFHIVKAIKVVKPRKS